MKHTKTPVKWFEHKGENSILLDADGHTVLITTQYGFETDPQGVDLVKAVNNFNGLVEALEAVYALYDDAVLVWGEDDELKAVKAFQDARAALAKAKGE